MKTLDPMTLPLVGSQIIEASAGTGKTYTIGSLFLRCLFELDLSIEKILVVTFTDAATKELRTRVRERLREALDGFEGKPTEEPFLRECLVLYGHRKEEMVQKLRESLFRFDEASIFTIHGFCFRILQENPLEGNALQSLQLLPKQEELLQDIVDDYWRIFLYNESAYFIQYLLLEKLNSAVLLELIQKSPLDKNLILLPNQERLSIYTPKDIVVFEESFVALAEDWKKERAELESFFLHSEALNRKSYSKTKVGKLLSSLHSFLQGKPKITISDDTLAYFAIETVATSYKKGFEHTVAPDLCNKISLFLENKKRLSRLFKEHWIGLKINFLSYVHSRLLQFEQEKGLLTFDGLLQKVHFLLGDGIRGRRFVEQIQNRFEVALIDEFQDTNAVQYQIFHTFFHKKKRMFLIGDPKQSIYAFRGADLFTYLEARKDADQQWTLNTNWRSETRLLEALHCFYQNLSWPPFFFDEIEFQTVQPSEKSNQIRLQDEHGSVGGWILKYFQQDSSEAKPPPKSVLEENIFQEVLWDILELLSKARTQNIWIETPQGKKTLQPSDLAILVRENSQALYFQNELNQLGIPSIINKRESLWNSAEVSELEEILKAIREPFREKKIRNALVTRILGYTGEQLLHLSENEKALESMSLRFLRLQESWDRDGFSVMFRKFLVGFEVIPHLLHLQDGEKRVTNLLHLAEKIQKVTYQEKMTLSRCIYWLSEKRIRRKKTEELEDMRSDSDGDTVQIQTIHGSKGLEYSIVFCPTLWSSKDSIQSEKHQFAFHSPERKNKLTLDLGSEQFENNKEWAKDESIAEDLRLLYVALTRAKHRVYLYAGQANGCECSALNYLFHAPREDVDIKARRSSLEARIKKTPDIDLYNEIVEKVNQSKQTIQLEIPAPRKLTRYVGNWKEEETQQASILPSRISQQVVPQIVSSFSSLSSRQSFVEQFYQLEIMDYDSEVTVATESQQTDALFAFPKGTSTGHMFHSLFESIDFQEDPYSLFVQNEIKKLCQIHGLDVLECQGVVQDCLSDVLNAPLFYGKQKVYLKDISRKSRLDELEFLFPVNSSTFGKISAYFQEKECSIPLDLATFRENTFSGYLKGFIDCVFEWKDQFFIVDYKSNFLGNSLEDYNQDSLRKAMGHHQYGLQYLLYSIALHKYLSFRKKEYDYEKHFGGVFYLFIRGIRKDNKNHGIYFDRLSVEMMEEFSSFFAWKDENP